LQGIIKVSEVAGIPEVLPEMKAVEKGKSTMQSRSTPVQMSVRPDL